MNQIFFLMRRRGDAENAALDLILIQKISASPRLRVNQIKAILDV